MDEEGTETSWKDVLPEDLKGSPSLESVKDVASLAKQFVDAQKFIGSSIRIPSPEAGEDDWKAFDEKMTAKVAGLVRVDPENPGRALKALGQPDAIDQYVLPEGIDKENPLVVAAFEAGLTKAQVKTLLEPIAAKSAEDKLLHESSVEQDRASLKLEWGAAFDKKMALISAVAKMTNAPENLISALSEGNIESNTAKWLDTIATKLGEEGQGFVQDGGSGNETMTPLEARERAAELGAQLLDMSPSDPRYNALVAKRVKYFEHAGSH